MKLRPVAQHPEIAIRTLKEDCPSMRVTMARRLCLAVRSDEDAGLSSFVPMVVATNTGRSPTSSNAHSLVSSP